jgi:lipoate-protein ligase A
LLVLNVLNQNNDPYVNMAMEEFVLMQLSHQEDCFMLWQNRPAIILGRHQNAWEEINRDYVQKQDIAVVRRLTGGGAVYHDLRNLNFTFVVADRGHGFDFHRFARPVIAALAELGVKAEMSGRNDILIDGRKFSGNAEYRHNGRLLHHGTLLFSSDLTVLSEALLVKPQKIASKGIKSVRSRVTNISEYVDGAVSLEDFRQALLRAAALEFGSSLRDYALTGADQAAIEQFYNQRYSTWQWNYGQTPEFNLRRDARYSFGEVDVRLNVRHGLIAGCNIYGDFFSNADLFELEQRLQGLELTRESLLAALDDGVVQECIPGLDAESFVALVLP